MHIFHCMRQEASHMIVRRYVICNFIHTVRATRVTDGGKEVGGAKGTEQRKGAGARDKERDCLRGLLNLKL